MMAAVEVQNGYKYYGSSSKPKIILNYLNMNVMHGSIYGLLGASGCGKTTLLSCIVGQRQLNSGEVTVLGMRPGIPGSEVPGPRIGYMPQEIALVEEMTVKETIYYFGRIYGLSDDRIRDKFKLLRDLLQLPSPKHLIKKCSGGQQRRVSFACAMIHDPELLILDEPTVGLDPMLREKIWDFLVDSTRNSKMAVIITTHYIEEAKQANCIGLMRNGILLAEDTPHNIMSSFQVSSIEDAFLFLSSQQGKLDVVDANTITQRLQPPAPAITSIEVTEPVALERNSLKHDRIRTPASDYINTSGYKMQNKKKFLLTTRGRVKALMSKNFIQLFRQPSGVIFMLLFPIIQLSCFYLAIGKTPGDLKLGIVDEEIANYESCFDHNLITVYTRGDECEFNKISCRYIAELGDNYVERIYYETYDKALVAAKATDIVGFIHFPHNFSLAMQEILNHGRSVDSSVFNWSELTVRIDMTDQQISYFLERRLRNTFNAFLKNVLQDCNLSEALGRAPVQFMEPVYGSHDIEFQQYVAPGVVMTMVFFLATLMTAAVFISEKTDGVWDRTLIAGVSATEMLWAHLLTQFIIMVVQSLEVVIYIGLVFDTYNKGDNATLIGLLTLTAFCGMLFGLLISVFCTSHTTANFVTTGAFYPMIILCGLLWPLEGMPKSLQDVVMFFPFTIPSISARNIIEKGWSITNSQVYNGFIVMSAWIIFFFTVCLVGLRRKT